MLKALPRTTPTERTPSKRSRTKPPSLKKGKKKSPKEQKATAKALVKLPKKGNMPANEKSHSPKTTKVGDANNQSLVSKNPLSK